MAHLFLDGLPPRAETYTATTKAKAIRQRLGHASAAITLDVYAELVDDDLGAVADDLDQAGAASIVVESVVKARSTGKRKPRLPSVSI